MNMNLIDAVRTEPLENIKSIVRSKGIPFDSLWLDYTVLNTALECRRKDVAEYLLENNCRVNKFSLTQEAVSTPLHNAVILGDLNLVIELLKRKASIVAVDAQGNTPLHLAFIQKEDQIIDVILSVIQDTESYKNLKNSIGLSHMHIACTRKNVKVINRFLKTDINIEHSVKEDSQSFANYTSLHFATKFRSSIAVKLLLEAGANSQAKDINGQTPLQLANEDFVESSIIVDSLSPETDRCYHTMSQFHLACLKNDPSLLKAFIDRGENPHMPVHYSSPFCPDYSPLHFGVQGSCEENVKLLLKYKVDNECLNEYYQTPLHLSLYTDNPKIIKLLYADAKLHENLTDCNGLDYLDVAVARNDLEQVKSYLDQGSNVNKRVTYEKQKFYQYTPLHFAISYQSIEVAKLLIERGAEINASDGSRYGTPLHLALKAGHEDLIELLLEKKANARALRPCDNATSIHVLVESYVRRRTNDQILKYVERLVNLGVDINAKTSSNSTALHLSCLYNDAKCTRLLLEFGADINITSKCGNTPFDLCMTKNDKILNRATGGLVEVLYDHVQKLKALGLEVNTRNEECCVKLMAVKNKWYPDRFKDEVLQTMQQQRQEEIVKLQKTKITTWTSLRQFLLLDAKKAAAYVRNELLKRFVEDDVLTREFPGYGYLIKYKYEQAVDRQNKRWKKKAMTIKEEMECQTTDDEIEEIPIVKKQRPEE